MKRVLCLIIIIITTVMLFCSCDTEKGEIKPNSVEVSDFDIQTAKQMLKKEIK